MTSEVLKSLLADPEFAQKYNIEKDDIPSNYTQGLQSKNIYVKIICTILLQINQGASDKELNTRISQLFNEIKR